MPPTRNRQKKRGGKKRPQVASPESPPSIPTLPSPLPLETFFATYAPAFQYNPNASASSEFYRLCDKFGWEREDSERQTARDNHQAALVRQFHLLYGSDVDDLEAWKRLCQAVRVDPIPDGLHACRKAVKYTFVNLIDLLDLQTTGEEVQLFPSEHALSEYTKGTGKFFPSNHELAGTLLNNLLRHIINPREGYAISSRGGISNRGRRGRRQRRNSVSPVS